MTLKDSANAVLYKVSTFVLNAVQLIVYYVADLFRPQLKFLCEMVLNSVGITMNGDEEYDIRVNDEKAFALIVAYGLTGIFECFIEQYVEAKNVEKTFEKVLQGNIFRVLGTLDIWSRIEGYLNKTFDIQTIENSWKDGGDHYDEFGEIIQMAGGPSSLYSCLNFDNTTDVAKAEVAQLNLIASKLALKPGMKVLDIGCGYGGLAEHLAKNYDVFVTGVSISKIMAQKAQERCAKLNVNIINCDYRQIPVEKYDRITCIEMMEHVGEQHHHEFYRIVHELLKEEGIFLLQVASTSQPYMFEYIKFCEKYLGMRLTFPKIQKTIQKACDYFVLEHLQNIGYNFGLTCNAGYAKHIELERIVTEKLGERIFRIGCLYLSAGALFKNRVMHSYQLVLSKNGLKYNYNPM